MNKPDEAREASTSLAFQDWLCSQGISKITPMDGHARRSFDAGYDAAESESRRRIEELEALMDKVISFELQPEIDTRGKYNRRITLDRARQLRRPDHWVIRTGPYCFNKSGELEWESMPSSRKPDFLERTRFASIPEALEAYKALKEKQDGESRRWKNEQRRDSRGSEKVL